MTKSKESYWLHQNNSAVCPYCEYKHEVEYHSGDGEIGEIECMCGKFFEYETSISVSYSSNGDCEKNKQMPHQLHKPKYSEHAPFTCQNCYLEFYDWQLPGGQYQKLKEGEFVITADSAPFNTVAKHAAGSDKK